MAFFKFKVTVMKYWFIFYFVFLITKPASAQHDIDTRTLRIDTTYAAKVSASQVLNEVNYIPLETTKESLFAEISQLSITDKYFIIYDKETNCILFFFKNGKFYHKIKRDIYTTGGFSINRERNELVFSKGRLLYHYDFDGKKIKEESQKFLGKAYYISADTVIYADYRVSEKYLPDTISHEIYFTYNQIRKSEFFPYNMKNASILNEDSFEIFHEPFYEIGNNTSVYYCRPYDYNIYELSTGIVKKSFNFIFPLASALPETFFTDTSLKGKRTLYIQNHSDLFYGISYPYKIGENLFFKLNRWGDFNSYLYNLKSESLISIKNIVPDEITAYLPLTDLGHGPEFYNKNFLTSDGVYVYTNISSAVLFAAKESNSDKKILYKDVLNAYFSKGNRKNNPVIVQIRPKEIF